MPSGIQVDFDPKRMRFILTGGFQFLDVFRALPSRRFEPKLKAWAAPIVQLNVEYIRDLRNKGIVQVVTPTAESALNDFEKLTSGPVYLPFPTDHRFPVTPYPHQISTLDRTWNLGPAGIFAEMGVGKTFMTIQKAVARFQRGLIDRVLIICPETLRNTWFKEFKKFAPTDSYDFRLHATDDRSMPVWATERDDKLKVLAVSVEAMGVSERAYESVFAFFKGPTYGVVDESSRIKNPKAKRTERVISFGPYCKYKDILNGTPIAKGIQDLWSQFEFLDPNIIGCGDYWAFRTHYLVMGGFENKKIIGYQNIDELMKRIRPYVVEIRKKDVLKDLPDKVYKKIYVDATPEQKATLRQIKKPSDSYPDYIKAKNVLERMLRQQQVVGGFKPSTDITTGITSVTPYPENPKLKALLEFIETNIDGHKFIIWARYLHEIIAISEVLKEKYGPQAVAEYYGRINKEEKDESERRYCEDPGTRFLVGNPAAAGLGLTFISGETDVMFYYSGTFAYIDRAQSEDRSHRIGQKNSVLIIDCVMNGTIDRLFEESIAAKKDVDEYVKEQMALGRNLDL